MKTLDKEMTFNVHICGHVEKQIDLTYSDFNEGKLGKHIDVPSVVPNCSGTAVSVISFLDFVQPMQDCTHVIFKANDEFQATIPFAELKDALLIFKQDGALLEKGFPLRLFIPDGWSECLNIKSVTTIEFVQNTYGESKSTFGFKNLIQLSEL